jgi:hypothetical protein
MNREPLPLTELKLPTITLLLLLAVSPLLWTACKNHGSDHSAHDPQNTKGSEASVSALLPADGASVKILSPRSGEVYKGDSVPLEFQLKKGKRGEHVHAYIDGEMAGMFKTAKGTLTGIKPGEHTLELRVVTADHNAELDATDKIKFTVQ